LRSIRKKLWGRKSRKEKKRRNQREERKQHKKRAHRSRKERERKIERKRQENIRPERKIVRSLLSFYLYVVTRVSAQVDQTDLAGATDKRR